MWPVQVRFKKFYFKLHWAKMFVNYTVILCYLGFLINNAITCDKMTDFNWVVRFFRNWSKKCSKKFVFFREILCQTSKRLQVNHIPTSYSSTRCNQLFIHFHLDANVSPAFSFHNLLVKFCLGYIQITK